MATLNQNKTWGHGQEPHLWQGTVPSDAKELHQHPLTGMDSEKLSCYTSSLCMGWETTKLEGYSDSHQSEQDTTNFNDYFESHQKGG